MEEARGWEQELHTSQLHWGRFCKLDHELELIPPELHRAV